MGAGGEGRRRPGDKGGRGSSSNNELFFLAGARALCLLNAPSLAQHAVCAAPSFAQHAPCAAPLPAAAQVAGCSGGAALAKATRPPPERESRRGGVVAGALQREGVYTAGTAGPLTAPAARAWGGGASGGQGRGGARGGWLSARAAGGGGRPPPPPFPAAGAAYTRVAGRGGTCASAPPENPTCPRCCWQTNAGWRCETHPWHLTYRG